MFDRTLKYDGKNSRLQLFWATHIPGMIRTPIFSKDNKKGYVVSYIEKKRSYQLIEFCPFSGEMSWSIDIRNGGYGTPAISKDVLAVATDFHSVAGVDLSAGRLKWVFETDMRVRSPIGVNENNFLFSSGKSLYEIDPEGELVRKFDLNGGFFYGLVRAIEGLWISMATLNKKGVSCQFLVAFGDDGNIVWKYCLGEGGIISSDTSGFEIQHDCLYAAGLKTVHCISISSGQCIWKMDVKDVVGRQMPTYSDGILYVPAVSGAIIAIDCDRRSIMWRFNSESPVYTPVSICGGYVIAAADGVIYTLDSRCGKPVDQIPVGHSPYSAVVFNNDMAYIGGGDAPYHGRLYCFKCVSEAVPHEYVCNVSTFNAVVGAERCFLDVEISNPGSDILSVRVDSSPMSATMSNGEIFQSTPYDRKGDKFYFELPLRDTIVAGTYVVDIKITLASGQNIHRAGLVQVQRDKPLPRRVLLAIDPISQEAPLLSGAAVLQMVQSYYSQDVKSQEQIRKMIDFSKAISGYESWNVWRILLRRQISSSAMTVEDLPEYKS